MEQETARKKLAETNPLHHDDLFWLSEIRHRPIRVMWLNFIAGMFRGLGFALGVSMLAGAVLVITYKLVAHAVNLPLFGSYIAKFITEVQRQVGELARLRPQ